MSSYTIDLSTHGKDLKRVYDAIVSSDPEISWGVFNYAAGQSNALKPVSEGASGLDEFCDEFDDGKVQYGFARVDYNNMAKFVLVGWVGEGVPERTKGYFNAHFSTVAKYFHGYHVQITARSREDVSPAIILRKVDQAAGSKYAGASKKAVPLRPNYRAANEGAAEEDWGDTKPVVEKNELNKVESAYKPTKVDISSVRSQPRSTIDDGKSKPEPVRGSYQPIGKVDIAALRASAKESKFKDDGPAPLQSSYKPIGKVDIGAIRAAASKKDSKPLPAPEEEPVARAAAPADDEDDFSGQPVSQRMRAFGGSTPAAPHGIDDADDLSGKSVKDRMKTFSAGSGRLTELPKPKPSGTVGSRFKAATSATGTAPAVPKGVFANESSKAISGFKDFASQGGKTPAQLWAEKHAKTGGAAAPVASSAPETYEEQESPNTSSLRSQFDSVAVADDDQESSGPSAKDAEPVVHEEPKATFADITSRFARKPEESDVERSVPPPPPVRDVQEEEEVAPALPLRSQPKEEEEAPPALPSRSQPAHHEEEEQAPALPTRSVAKDLEEPAPSLPSRPLGVNGITAVVIYDYEKDEDNEIALVEGEIVTNIEKVDEDWWIGTSARGETGLFPANYVEESSGEGAHASLPAADASVSHEDSGVGSSTTSASAVAEYDYEAEEEGELTFKEGDVITDISFDDDAWWSGVCHGVRGLFPSNYVQLK